jgi:tight adherence protein B
MSPLTIIIIGGVIAVILLILGVIVSSREEHSLVEERLGRYLEEEQAAREPGQKSAPLTDALNSLAGQFAWGDNLSKELARADLKLKVGEYLALMVISASALGIIAFFIGGRNTIVAIIGAVLGLFLPRIYVGMQQGKRLLRFNDQLSDMLNLMVNGLRAGYSSMQAMEAVSKELPPPLCDEFRRVVQEMQLGVSMEHTLDNLLRRIPSTDLDLVITAINVQREVGGNLAEILATISHTIRERVRIKGEIRVLTSQVMYSGRFLSLMPVIIIGAMYLLNKKYFEYFLMPETRIIGIIALVGAAVLVIVGSIVMNKIGKIEV